MAWLLYLRVILAVIASIMLGFVISYRWQHDQHPLMGGREIIVAILIGITVLRMVLRRPSGPHNLPDHRANNPPAS